MRVDLVDLLACTLSEFLEPQQRAPLRFVSVFFVLAILFLLCFLRKVSLCGNIWFIRFYAIFVLFSTCTGSQKTAERFLFAQYRVKLSGGFAILRLRRNAVRIARYVLNDIDKVSINYGSPSAQT